MNEPIASTNGVRPPARASPTARHPLAPPKATRLEPFPDFDLDMAYSYPDFGNPYTTLSPNGTASGVRNGNGVEAGSSYSWRSPQDSPQKSPPPPSPDLSADSSEKKASVVNGHAEEVSPQPSGAKALARDENMREYSLLVATREALQADQRYNQIEQEMNESREQRL